MYLRLVRSQLPGQHLQGRRQNTHLRPTSCVPKLSCGYVYAAGRGLSGSRTVYSKGARATRSVFHHVFWPTAGFFSLGLVVSQSPHRRMGGVLLSIRLASGPWFQTPAPATCAYLDFTQALPGSLTAGALFRPQPWWWTSLYWLPPYARICAVASYAGGAAQFARAPGSKCLLLIPRYGPEVSLLRLPSGQLFVVSSGVFASRGSLGFYNQPEIFPATTAGFWRQLGFAPQVRGTAKNPNDHPHGGRTGAIRYPLTPWGRTAKKSRSPRLVPRLKSLAKRKVRSRESLLPYWMDVVPADVTAADVDADVGADSALTPSSSDLDS